MEEPSSGLIELLADWTWEQDPEFRFISVSSHAPAVPGHVPAAGGFDPVAFFAYPNKPTMKTLTLTWITACSK